MITNNNYNESRRKTYQQLTFTDDFMFRKVLMHDADLCRRLVELLLDVEVDHIAYKDDEHSIATTNEKKSVRLDVYLKDDEGTVFDLEMQNQKDEDLPRRTRYYQSMLDIDHMDSGASYDELPDSYIVFICTFDPYGEQLPKYEFRELCKEDPTIELGSGTAKVFINAKSNSKNVTSEMRAFLDYLCGMDASSDLTRDIETGIKRAKANRPWEREYMTLEDHLKVQSKRWKEEGRKEGLAEGESRARMDAVDRLVADGIYDSEKACSVLGVSVEEYKEYTKLNKN